MGEAASCHGPQSCFGHPLFFSHILTRLLQSAEGVQSTATKALTGRAAAAEVVYIAHRIG